MSPSRATRGTIWARSAVSRRRSCSPSPTGDCAPGSWSGEVPLPVEIEGQDRHGTALRCELRVGPARPQGGLKEETPTTALHLNDPRVHGNDGSDDFEVPLNELQRQLPDGTRLRARTVCA
ncbi:DUF6304 family protein [Streptomyces sp. L7]